MPWLILAYSLLAIDCQACENMTICHPNSLLTTSQLLWGLLVLTSFLLRELFIFFHLLMPFHFLKSPFLSFFLSLSPSCSLYLSSLFFLRCVNRLKDLTAYNMERTITILGTIDNCKKAESLISAKLRASYESDMNQFMQNTVSGLLCKKKETILISLPVFAHSVHRVFPPTFYLCYLLSTHFL